MTLSAGTRLGPYEILAAIGAGGMGEVYRAHDSRLSREVAVKVLPASFAADPERLRRFEQEARAASALNHPNIVAIYDVGVQDGVSYIAMELVDGASLRDLGASGPLPPRRVLDIAAQIADGLSKAHAAGIVHRDLKPENVMVSKDGYVKILDFGLAKAQSTSSDGGSQMPTTAPETGAGMVLGTVAYMSPEQASGKRVDYRSDQFSLGTVVYELLSGKRPFERPTAVETMSAIIREEPPPISQSGVLCPAPLRWILDRCHAKEPEGRYASTLDLARELKSLRDHFSELSSTSSAREASPASPPRGRIGAAGFAALAAAFVLGGGAVRLFWQEAPLPSPSLQYLTYAGQDQSPAASPDGSLVAFSSTRDGQARIWLHQVKNGTETALTAGSDTDPRFAPDGSAILYTKTAGGRFSLYRVSVLGGEERRLIDDAFFGDWSPDGKKIAFARLGISGSLEDGVFTGDADGSGEKLLVKREGKALAYPRWSPDGRLIAVAQVGSYAPGLEELLLIDPSSGKMTELPSATGGGSIHGLVWSSPDSLLYEVTLTAAAPGTAGGPSLLYRQPIRGGQARQVFSLPANGSAVDVLAEGNVVLDMLSQRENLRLSPLDTKIGAPARWLTHGIATDRQPIFSPDGKWVIFSSGRNGFINLWKIALSTGDLRRLTETAGVDWDPTFMPDGRSIVFSSNRTGHFEIWKAEADGSHPAEVTHENLDCENPAVAPDGAWIYFVEAIGKRSGNWRVHPDGSGIEVFLPGVLGIPEISPDNSLLAAQGRNNALSVVTTSREKTVISKIPAAFDGGTLGGRYRWLPGKHTLVFTGFDGAGRAGLFVQDIGPGIPIRPRRFSAFESETAAETFDVSPDGKALVTAEQELQADIYSLKNVPGVQRKTPKPQ